MRLCAFAVLLFQCQRKRYEGGKNSELRTPNSELPHSFSLGDLGVAGVAACLLISSLY